MTEAQSAFSCPTTVGDMAWLEVLSIARSRVVDHLVDGVDGHSAEGTGAEHMISVLDPESITMVSSERASRGLCGSPLCPQGISSDAVEDRGDRPMGSRTRDMGAASDSESDSGHPSDSGGEEAGSDDDLADTLVSRRRTFFPARHFCGPQCRSAMKRWARSAMETSDNDPHLTERVLSLFPGLRRAIEAVGASADNSARAVQEKESRVEEVASAHADSRASAAVRSAQLGLPLAGHRFVGGMWTSVPARALSLAFCRISIRTIAVFRKNAVGLPQDCGLNPGSLFSVLADSLPSWNDAAAAVASTGLRGVDRARVAALRQDFASQLVAETRRASLLLRVNLAESAEAMRVIRGVCGTFHVQDLTLSSKSIQPLDPETRLLFLLALLTATTVTDPHVRSLMVPTHDSLIETLEAMHVARDQFCRLARQFFGV